MITIGERRKELLNNPSVGTHLRTLAVAARCANRARHVVCDATAAAAGDVRAFARVLTLTCCAFTHDDTLLGANQNDCVTADEEKA